MSEEEAETWDLGGECSIWCDSVHGDLHMNLALYLDVLSQPPKLETNVASSLRLPTALAHPRRQWTMLPIADDSPRRTMTPPTPQRARAPSSAAWLLFTRPLTASRSLTLCRLPPHLPAQRPARPLNIHILYMTLGMYPGRPSSLHRPRSLRATCHRISRDRQLPAPSTSTLRNPKPSKLSPSRSPGRLWQRMRTRLRSGSTPLSSGVQRWATRAHRSRGRARRVAGAARSSAGRIRGHSPSRCLPRATSVFAQSIRPSNFASRRHSPRRAPPSLSTMILPCVFAAVHFV